MDTAATKSAQKSFFMKPWKYIGSIRRKFPNMGVILVAAILFELISALQFGYTRAMLEGELEMHAESELTMKSIQIRGRLTAVTNTLLDHFNDARRNLAEPDSQYIVALRLLDAHPTITGGGMAFKPYYYAEKGRLFEPWALRNDGGGTVIQMGSDSHDYTQMEFYWKTLETGSTYWSDPYYDEMGTHEMISTVAEPLTDSKGDTVGVIGLDITLKNLGDTINNRHLYPSSFDILLTESGNLIAGPSVAFTDPGEVEKAIALINDSSVTRHQGMRGRTTIIKQDNLYITCSYMRGNPHWQLAVVCYEDEVYGKLTQVRWNIMGLLLLGLLLMGYIVYRSARSSRRLQEADMKNERINSELNIAKQIQQEMLPKRYPPYPDRHDIDIYGMLEPAKEVGGDLYDFFIRDEKLFFCIGDVSGKGVPSALVMSVMHAHFRSVITHESNPERIMKNLNTTATEGNDTNMFVTIFVGVIDLPTGRMRYCNGGHDRPMVIEDGLVRELPARANVAIGIIDDMEFHVQEEMLKPGAMLFLYTDGLTEARNSTGDFYGVKRMQKALEELATKGLSAEKMLSGMAQHVRDFVGESEQSDDLTMMAIRYTPHNGINLLHESITMKNDVSEVDRLGDFVKALSKRLQMTPSKAANLRLAIEEAVVNVMNYAYPQETDGEVTVEADVVAATTDEGRETQQLNIRITDQGVAFDPTERKEIDTSLSAEERPIGGLGIYLIRELVDSINYERQEDTNTLTLRVNLNNNPIKINVYEDNNS